MRLRIISLVLAGVALGAGGYWMGQRNQAPGAGAGLAAGPQGHGSTDGAEGADALRLELDRLSRRIASLESGPAIASRQPASAQAAFSGLPVEREEGTGEQLQAAVDDQITELERRLRHQADGGPEAQALGEVITDVLSGELGKSIGITSPDGLRTECRGSMCQINARYRDAGAAEDAGIMLSMELGSLLPRGRSYVRATSDGGYELVMFAAQDAGASLLALNGDSR